MPITENKFTAEELSTAVAANPELLNVVTGHLKSNKFVVQNEAEHQQFLTNHENVIVARKTGEHAATIEKDVYDLTGIQKTGDEKYYEYLKRAFKDKIGDVEKLQGELKTLKEKGGNTSEVDKQRIVELEKKITETENGYKEKLTAKDKQLLDTQTEFAISAKLADIRAKYKANIPESLIKLAEKAVTDELKGKARIMDVDGTPTLVFVDDKGAPVIDQTTMRAAGVEYFIGKADALKDLIDPGKQQGGSGTPPGGPAGGGANGGEGGSGEAGKYTGLPATVKTKVGLTDHLKQLGIMDGTPEFSEIFDRDGANLPLR